MEASDKADYIIRQLLSFARKQPQLIERFDLNEIIGSRIALVSNLAAAPL
ncbi:MAG: hypothetical protein ACKVOL_00015 [Novosphingobium sp.]